MKTRPVSEELIHAETKTDIREDSHNGANCPFSL